MATALVLKTSEELNTPFPIRLRKPPLQNIGRADLTGAGAMLETSWLKYAMRVRLSPLPLIGVVAQLGERPTEDWKVLGSSPSHSILCRDSVVWFIILPCHGSGRGFKSHSRRFYGGLFQPGKMSDCLSDDADSNSVPSAFRSGQAKQVRSNPTITLWWSWGSWLT